MTFEEAVEVYGPPVAYTRRRGPVWRINGELVYATDLLGLDEIACGC